MSARRLSPRDRRRALELLPREHLAELTTRFELDVEDRRSIRGLEKEVERIRGEAGFEQIARVLGVPRPTRGK